jgi:hypothetical protein
MILRAFGYEDAGDSTFALDGRGKETVELFLPTEENGRSLAETHIEDGKKIKYQCSGQTFTCKYLRTTEQAAAEPMVIRSVGQPPMQFPEVTGDLDENGMPMRYHKTQTKRMFDALTMPVETVQQLRNYFAAAAKLYGVLPLRKLLEIYNSQNPAISQEDFLAVAEVIRHEENHYAILGQENRLRHVAPSRPMDREVVAECFYTFGWEDYESVTAKQQGKRYYIPKKQELLCYADEEYHEETPESSDMRRYLRSKATPEMAELMLLELEDAFYCDASFQIAAERLDELGLKFVSEADVERFSELAMKLSDGIRRPSLRGLTPNEAARSRSAVMMPNMEGRPQAKTVKVGRNEPCPCGSGKKYKRCCGR